MLDLVLLFTYILVALGDELCVQVKNGALQGKYMETRGGRKIYAFTGIPYAEPPVGDLRFKTAVPVKDWTGVKDATQAHAMCPQRNIFIRSEVVEGNEDCLYLNVYKPEITNKESKLDVMVYIHGGGWLCGSASMYGPEILLDRDVVLVTINYRLGALGLYSTGDNVVPGNNALKDQVLALKWVKENIEHFGGDANSVTIFGESAGGASVHLHMLSPLSKGLFHRAIAQSGSGLCPWAFDPNNMVVRNSKYLAKVLNCPTDSSEEMVECLKKVDSYKIMEQDKEFITWDVDPIIPFRPTIEAAGPHAFIDAHPADVIKSGNINNVPLMLGITTEEGAIKSATIFGVPLLDELKKDLNKLLGISLLFDERARDPPKVTEEVRSFYFGDNELDTSMISAVTNLYTDGWFLNGMDALVVLHKKFAKHPIYYYLFGHRGIGSYTEVFGDPVNDYGVCHCDELLYLFPIGDILFPNRKPDEADINMSKVMTTLFSNFAKQSDPTPKESMFNKWDPVSCPDKMEFFNMKGPDNLKMDEGLYMDRAKFWRNLEDDVKRNQYLKR